MVSLDHRLNHLFSIKECMTCGALYTRNCGCSKGSLEDTILVPVPDSSQQPPHNCTTCGDPVDGLYCRPYAFVRKCLNEGWYTIHDENEILNTSKSSNHNTNIVSAPQEPFVFNQDPGQNSSRSPPHIDHHCCYECGDSSDDIFCQRCTSLKILLRVYLRSTMMETISDDDDFETFEYVAYSRMTTTLCFDLEENSSGSTTTLSDYSLLDYEVFYLNDDHIEEKSSGSTTTNADFSLPKYDSFIFDLSINLFPPADRE
ncbi:hypothetical protein Tco_0777919 [Tanacetum coccineum]